MHKEDTLYLEAYEKLLNAWTYFVADSSEIPANSLSENFKMMFNSYLQCHLAAPEGTRDKVGGMWLQKCVCHFFFIKVYFCENKNILLEMVLSNQSEVLALIHVWYSLKFCIFPDDSFLWYTIMMNRF